jgi:GNAT superfamily N-acetyltransferase
MVTYDLHSGGEAEIVTFGLLPEFVGRGLGGFALTLGIQQAWALAPSVKRVWLHTSTFDHPRALPNYHRRGFRTFKTEQGDRDTEQSEREISQSERETSQSARESGQSGREAE